MNHSNGRLKGGFFFATLALLLSYGGLASAATLLPNGKQQFFDANGKPLAGGAVTFSIPGTTTAKQTWQDAAQTILNTNPVALDVNGSAVIYGAGCYRQIVKDSGGNTIWDQPTCDTSSTNLIWAGQSTGTANSQTLTASNFSSADGQTVSFIAGLSNTGPLGLIINGGGAISVLKDTAGGSFSLGGGEVVAGNSVQVVYEATRGAFHLVNNPAGAGNPLSTLSASGTTDLGSAASRLVKITGSSTISSFGSSASLSFPGYTLIFSGTVTLVNSSNLQLPGGTNLSISPGDSVQAVYLGSGAWQVFGTAAGGIAGEIRTFATAACPSGWLEAAGQTVATTTYPQLSAALGTTWGTSSGNVVLPESRGRFARGWDHGAGIDSGRSFGTLQNDQLQDHQHTYTPSQALGIVNGTSFAVTAAAVGSGTNTTDPVTGNHGSESRPKNFTVTYCIKY
jgi:microcystin-dependent protein